MSSNRGSYASHWWSAVATPKRKSRGSAVLTLEKPIPFARPGNDRSRAVPGWPAALGGLAGQVALETVGSGTVGHDRRAAGGGAPAPREPASPGPPGARPGAGRGLRRDPAGGERRPVSLAARGAVQDHV